jgi:hypothetical protein
MVGGIHKMSRQLAGKNPYKKTKVFKKSSITKTQKGTDLKHDVFKVVENLVEEKGQLSFKPSLQKSLVRQILSTDFTILPRKEIIKNVIYAMLLLTFGSFSAMEYKKVSRLKGELSVQKQMAIDEISRLKNENTSLVEKTQQTEREISELKKENTFLEEKNQDFEKEVEVKHQKDRSFVQESSKGSQTKSNTPTTEEINRKISNTDYIQLTSLVKNYVYLVPIGIVIILPILVKHFSSISLYIEKKISDLKASLFGSSPLRNVTPPVSEAIYKNNDILTDKMTEEEYRIIQVGHWKYPDYNNYLLKPTRKIILGDKYVRSF